MLKRCKYCGKVFNAVGTQECCDGPHYSVCEVCGKTFEVDPRNVKRCCSRKCSAKLRAKTIASEVKICELCGKPFHPKNNTSRYCDGPHYRPCPVCDKPVLIKKGYEYAPASCCSKECTTILRKKTCTDKYGVDIASKSPEVRKKLHDAAIAAETSKIETCMKRYGVTNVAKDPEIRARISNTLKSKSDKKESK